MSGTEPPRKSAFGTVRDVLGREDTVDTLEALRQSISGENRREAPISECAIGFDSNVFLRLGGHPKRADVLDYLDEKHRKPLILPAQTIQEFWNNRLSNVKTVASSISQKLEDLEKEVRKVEDDAGDFRERIERVIEDFKVEYGYVMEEATTRNTVSVIDMLQRRARVVDVPFVQLQALASLRHSTKTPPGFRDQGDGDFMVWVQYLVGLVQAKNDGQEFDKAVFVTNDRKDDWSRDNQAHPVLAAEVEKLVGCPLEVWTLDRLAQLIAESISD